MDKETALRFLREHQPMPADGDLSQGLLDEYDEARTFFIAHPDPACIPLFLNSFGEGDGFGVYQIVDEVVRGFSPSEVIPHLQAALQREEPGIRFWCAQIASQFPASELIGPLQGILLHDENADNRFMAAVGLEVIPDARVDDILRQALEREQETSVLEALMHALKWRRPRP